jgi:Protein of unknown function (DUF1553)/Protein of unknown function (DUF1549)/Planctomycete cytochrome C
LESLPLFSYDLFETLTVSCPIFPPAETTREARLIKTRLHLSVVREQPTRFGSTIAKSIFAWTMVLLFSPCSGAEKDSPEAIDFFEKEVRPILVVRCYECHSADEANGELLLDSRPAMDKGGTRGRVVNRELPEKSLLISAIDYKLPDLQMPPNGKMPDAEISILKKWIEMGAPDPRLEASTSQAKFDSIPVKLEKSTKHWAYQPIDTTPPSSQLSIDAIAIANLRDTGLELSPEADRRTLIKRLYYDLTGLPPEYQDYQKWNDEKDSSWYSKLVEELLASPHYGERMARHWMDVARYADNKGYVFKESREYPHAYRYRDWLIRSFNNDLSYQEFIRYQLVADRLDPENKQGHLDAMGFLTLGRRFLNNKYDVIDDRIDVISRGLLGVTATCARCHDHKFDPVTAADYYSLFGVLENSTEPGDEPSPMRLTDSEKRSPSFVLLRGSPGNRGPKVDPKFFEFLNVDKPIALKTGSGRIELADAIASEQNPLTSRVYVNRLWGWIFGQPFVDTPSDFGLRSDRPAQHAVLDALASQLIRGDWSTKQVIRAIVNSAVYKQSSLASPQGLQVDPENRLLWRANRKRMDFESYRDAMLKVAGDLDETIGGKSEKIDEAPFSKRRSVYAYIDRQNLPQLFRSFDFASPDSHVPQRLQTTVPQQGLVLMNSDMIRNIVQASVRSFESSSIEDKNKVSQQLPHLFQELMGRDASQDELQRLTLFLQQAETKLVDTPQNRWTYGYGSLNHESGEIQSFQLLPFCDGKHWRGASEYPDKKLGYCGLNDKGGHPGDRDGFTPIRRWTAPRSGTVEVNGSLEHKATEGDGVRATVVLNASQKVESWTAHKKKVSTKVKRIDVQAGDTLDLAVDCIESTNHDSFEWVVEIRYQDDKDFSHSKEHFSSQQPNPSTAWFQLSQALLMTNEFCFVD